jgi:hypothetical protein
MDSPFATWTSGLVGFFLSCKMSGVQAIQDHLRKSPQEPEAVCDNELRFAGYYPDCLPTFSTRVSTHSLTKSHELRFAMKVLEPRAFLLASQLVPDITVALKPFHLDPSEDSGIHRARPFFDLRTQIGNEKSRESESKHRTSLPHCLPWISMR